MVVKIFKTLMVKIQKFKGLVRRTCLLSHGYQKDRVLLSVFLICVSLIENHLNVSGFRTQFKPPAKLRRPVIVMKFSLKEMSRIVRKLAFCICENKGADQLRGYREADQHLCFRHMDSAIPLLSKSEISSL